MIVTVAKEGEFWRFERLPRSYIRSEDGLTLEPSALETLYEAQFAYSTLIKPNYLVITLTDAAPLFL